MNSLDRIILAVTEVANSSFDCGSVESKNPLQFEAAMKRASSARAALRLAIASALADERRRGVEEARYSTRIEAFDEVKAMIASHHAPHHWYFEWLIKKMNERIIDRAKAQEVG